MPSPDVNPYEAASVAATDLQHHLGRGRFDAAVVLGSGWQAAAGLLGETAGEVDLVKVYGFPEPSVAGHGGTARAVESDRRRLLVFLGRVHLYEGHSPATVVHGVRAATAAGAGTVVLTNAAGALDASLAVGQPVLIRDHINLTGRSPLSGPEPPAPYPSRFHDVTDLYSRRLRAIALDAEPALAEGVYAALNGPHYETPAEIGMLRALGADLVGMSTAMEAIAAHHAGAEVLALSLVTNLAAGVSATPLDHAEVLAAGREAEGRLARLLQAIVARL
ncbi:MAG: purine-nucleoside phosphorylase [Acidimicrobiales bacterium]